MEPSLAVLPLDVAGDVHEEGDGKPRSASGECRVFSRLSGFMMGFLGLLIGPFKGRKMRGKKDSTM